MSLPGEARGRDHERGLVDRVVIVENVATVLHLLAMAMAMAMAMALGLGTVMTTDVTLLRRLNAPFGEVDAVAVEWAHGVVFAALAALWVGGSTLLALRTGLRPDAVSPKLAARLALVGGLTLLAVGGRGARAGAAA